MFSTNFATDAGVGGCNSDYKFIFLNTQPGGRYEIKSGTYGTPGYFSTNYPSGLQDTYTFQIASVWDGQWHVYRMHAKNSSIPGVSARSEEHTSELQSRLHLVCRLLLEKKNTDMRPSAYNLTLYDDADADP